jgi:outer membrane protein TolC
MGLDPADRVQLSADLIPEFIWVGEARARELAHERPDVRILEHQIEQLDAQIRFQEKQDHAIVSAFGNTGFQFGSGFTDGLNWTLGLQATWPIHNGGNDEALIAQFQEQQDQLELSIVDKLQQIDTEIRTALESLATARASVEDSAQSVISAQAALTKILLAYENDLAAWIDLRDAESALTAAQQTFVTTLFEYQLARADLAHAIGVRDLGDLIVPGIVEPPTIPDMPGLRMPEGAPPVPEIEGVEGQVVRPGEGGGTEIPSEEEDGGSE